MAMAPARAMSDFARMTSRTPNPVTYTALAQSRGFRELFERMTRRYGKPAFGIDTCMSRARRSRSRKNSSGAPFLQHAAFQAPFLPPKRRASRAC